MKKFQLLVALCVAAFLFSNSANAQPTEPQWVSTEVQKRNVVLEEFTGWQCQHCPDGHRIGQTYAAANPGRVFLVNIHQGGFAPEITNLYGWNLRTNEGTTLGYAPEADSGGQGVRSWPTGTVNRASTPWVTSRINWVDQGNAIMSQNSPVNVFTKASIDYHTRKLVVEVELYYTASSAAATNKLSVVLTQNEIIGAQIDYLPYYPAMHVGSLGNDIYIYRHQHVLRRFISSGGAFGEDITTTTEGSYVYRKYELDIPETIVDVNVPVKLQNLEVLAFVAEGRSNIYTGHGVKMELPENYATIALTATDKSTYSSTLKLAATPKIEIKNDSKTAITSFDVNVYHNASNNLIATKSFNGTLGVGETTTFEFDPIQFNVPGNHFLVYKVVSPVFSKEDDYIYFYDDVTISRSMFGLLEKAIVTTTFGFNDGRSSPPNFIPTANANGLSVINKNMVWPTNPNAYQNIGANNTTYAWYLPLHSSAGNAGRLVYFIFGEIDFHNVPNKELSFYYAYSMAHQTTGTATTLKVESSKDWGVTWDLVENVPLERTSAPDPAEGYYFFPQSPDHYRKATVNLNSLVNQDALLRINITCGSGGNVLFIDEISLSPLGSIEDDEYTSLNSIYPNPAKDYLTIDLKENARVVIFTLDGKKLFEEDKEEGLSNINFNVAPGTYILRTETPKGSAATKFIVE